MEQRERGCFGNDRMLRICFVVTSRHDSDLRLMHPKRVPNNHNPAPPSSTTGWSDPKHLLQIRSIRVQAVPGEAGRNGKVLLGENLAFAADNGRVVSPRR